ncbi:MAG: class I SAM-dependent methyltransferase, partial [Bacteroidetes bacterium]|nr:class I SAM-dependent methyltransferase [Bacteroidota bacterium]
MEKIRKYFPDLTGKMVDQMGKLEDLYRYWNARINVVSRKDIDSLMERHVLHSLSIARIIGFSQGSRIMDAGTGGGFPGIPLAIVFPEAEFTLVDSIGKKV